MKEFIAEPGGRYTYADDIINLQDMVLAVGSLLDGCSNFIISGCRCQGAVITPGYVWLGGKIRRFEGCADASYPYYIYEKNSNESVTYANEVNKRGRACYLASGGRSVPDTADPVTGAMPQFIEVTADYAPCLVDQFFGRYALMTDSPFTRQTVRKDLLLTGTVTVEKGIESKHSLLVSPTGSKKILRGYFPEASVARLEAGTNAAPVAAVVFDLLKGSVTVESKGIVAASFTERLCTLSDLRSDTVRAGSLYFTGNQLKNIAERSDKGTVRVNYDGYEGGTAYFRNFEVYDGKRCAIPLLQVCGADKRVAVHAVLAVDSAHGITLSDTDHALTDAAFGGTIRWCDQLGAEAAVVGYVADKHPHFSIANTVGGILLVPKNFVDVQGDLQVNGISIAKTYATQRALTEGLNRKVDAVEGKGLSTKDFTQELYDKLNAIASGSFAGEDTPQSEGYVTTTQVAAELRKKADRLLGGLNEGEQQTAAGNLGVHSKEEADGRFGRLAELFQDYIAYLVGQGKSTTAAQQILRDKLAAAGSKELVTNYMRKDGKLSDLILPDDNARKSACKTLGAAYAADYQPKLLDTGWLQMSNSGSGTDTSKLFVRQIGSIVCIQGRINTARRDGSNEGGIIAVIPNKVEPPKYGLRTTMAHWNDDHKYNRGSSFTIDAGSRYVRIYERGMYNTEINIHFSYMT
ncbi:hypothetical protein [uncultured Alistipes sp.]|jgi:hypothetical protein|uniref:hypothetical protein n=1 Tax=Alistipes sp. TaxID=1872444 RepID=UPI00266CE3C4|nr:hypothetical protein [uncultured Alistipes sp.]